MSQDPLLSLGLHPDDDANRRLVSAVHPPDWQNPIPAGRYDLIILGGGPAGLVAASSAAGLGARTALIERHLLGGDCLNVGCIPSKALLAAANAAHAVRHAARFGIHSSPPVVDFPEVMARMRNLRATIAPHDSARRFQELGVDVFLGHGRFASPDTIEVGGRELCFRRALIATGARPSLPNVPGLAQAGVLTNENVFNLTTLPRHLVVLGSGPIACELAQAFRRLGSEVTLLARRDRLLSREDPEAGKRVANRLQIEGVSLHWNVVLDHVERRPDGTLRIDFVQGSKAASLEASHLLVAIGRTPNSDGLALNRASIQCDSTGTIQVDDHLRTTNPRVFAAGDVCLPHRFTHAADFAARTVIQNALFPGRKRFSKLTIPHCTFTDPEVAQVGHSLASAHAVGLRVTHFTRRFAAVDRACTDDTTDGFVRILVRQGSDQIVGATIVGAHAGELISEVATAMAAGMGLGSLANVIHPYPTLAEAIRQCGDDYNRTRLTASARTWIGHWLRWNRNR